MTDRLGNAAHEDRPQVRYAGSLWEVIDNRSSFQHEVSFQEILIRPLKLFGPKPKWVTLEECDLCR